MEAQLTAGGAPLLGEPLPIELGNTAYAIRGRLQDGLQTPEHLASWLLAGRPRLPVLLSDTDLAEVNDDDLARAQEIRDAIRSVSAAVVDHRDPDRGAVSTLNRNARKTLRWRELRTDPQLHTIVCTNGRPVSAALAAIADDAIGLFAGPLRHELQACQGPGCVLYYVRDNPRRAWCSAGCGNRARAARHYTKTRRA